MTSRPKISENFFGFRPWRALGKQLFGTLLAIWSLGLSLHAEERREFPSYREVEVYFSSLGYTYEAWRAGMRDIPRVYFADVPRRWQKNSSTVTVTQKKQLFFRAILPLVLRASELITEDRKRAEKLVVRLNENETIPSEEDLWLHRLALRYGAIEVEEEELNRIKLEELMIRVDTVPVALALGQAAYESGYGTSRFSGLGNALYGQWAWGKGMKPDSQRKGEHGDHRGRGFESPQASAIAYTLNLNTHFAYDRFRQRRSEFRREDKPLVGSVLAETLDRYAETGMKYVRSLQGIIRVNKLHQAEEAHLRDMAPVLLVAVDESGKAVK